MSQSDSHGRRVIAQAIRILFGHDLCRFGFA
jgi:hypothetical protein